jgi:hypothetical protein
VQGAGGGPLPAGSLALVAGAGDLEHLESPGELRRGVPGEREREHVWGIGRTGRDAPGDAAGQDARLARTRAGHDREWRALAADRLALGLVEPVEQAVGGRGRPCHPSDRTDAV